MRLSRSMISPLFAPASFRRSFHHVKLSGPVMRKPVRAIECVPRLSGGAGQSKKVRSVPGRASASA
jgi:hypothetical protein